MSLFVGLLAATVTTYLLGYGMAAAFIGFGAGVVAGWLIASEVNGPKP